MILGGVRKLNAVDDGSERSETDGTVVYEAFWLDERLMVGLVGLIGVTGSECI